MFTVSSRKLTQPEGMDPRPVDVRLWEVNSFPKPTVTKIPVNDEQQPPSPPKLNNALSEYIKVPPPAPESPSSKQTITTTTDNPTTAEMFRAAICAIVVYDVTSLESYNEAVGTFYGMVRRMCPSSIVFLVGNKLDNQLRVCHEITQLATQFSQAEGVLHLTMSLKYPHGISMLEDMVRLQIAGLVRCMEDDVYDISDITRDASPSPTRPLESDGENGGGGGDVDDDEAESEKKDDDMKPPKLVVSDAAFVETLEKLVVHHRSTSTVEDILGHFHSQPTGFDSLQPTVATSDEEVLTSAIYGLHKKIQYLVSTQEIEGVGGEEECPDAAGDTGDAGAASSSMVEDVTHDQLLSAYTELGRDAPYSNASKISATAMSAAAASTRRDQRRGVMTSRVPPASPPPTPPPSGPPELRINVGIRSGESAVIEVYDGDDTTDVARRFIRKHDLTNTKDALDGLVRQIQRCRDMKKKNLTSPKGGSDTSGDALGGRKDSRVAGGPVSPTKLSSRNAVLGRLDVDLSNGTKRSLVLREGDDPKLILAAFCGRHNGLVSPTQQRTLIGILEDALSDHNKRRAQRERQEARERQQAKLSAATRAGRK
jgi:hypothetical protein